MDYQVESPLASRTRACRFAPDRARYVYRSRSDPSGFFENRRAAAPHGMQGQLRKNEQCVLMVRICHGRQISASCVLYDQNGTDNIREVTSALSHGFCEFTRAAIESRVVPVAIFSSGFRKSGLCRTFLVLYNAWPETEHFSSAFSRETPKLFRCERLYFNGLCESNGRILSCYKSMGDAEYGSR